MIEKRPAAVKKVQKRADILLSGRKNPEDFLIIIKESGKTAFKERRKDMKGKRKQNADGGLVFAMTAGMLAGCGNSAPA